MRRYNNSPAPEEELQDIFEKVIGTRLGNDFFAEIKGAVKNSNLPEDYKEAVKGILQ